LEDVKELTWDEWVHEKRQQFVTLIASIVFDPIFGHVIMACILVNMLTMAMEHKGQPDGLTTFIDYSNLAFTAIFTLEFLMKLIALGVRGYFRDGPNVFDAVICIASLVELGLGGGGPLLVLRAFRAIRILKMIRFMPGLLKQVRILLVVVLGMGGFLTLLTVLIIMYAIVGMHLFGGKFDSLEVEGEVTRSNFDSLLWSSVTVFQVLTLDEWPKVMGYGYSTLGLPAILYFTSLVLLGHFVMLNLLIAVMFEEFATVQKEDDTRMIAEMEHRSRVNKKGFKRLKDLVAGRRDLFLGEMWVHWKVSVYSSKKRPIPEDWLPRQPVDEEECVVDEEVEQDSEGCFTYFFHVVTLGATREEAASAMVTPEASDAPDGGNPVEEADGTTEEEKKRI